MLAVIWACLGSTKHSIERGGFDKRLGLIPIINLYFFIKVSDKPNWWFLLTLIPGVNLVMFSAVALNNLSKLGEYDSQYKTLLIILYPLKSRGVM